MIALPWRPVGLAQPEGGDHWDDISTFVRTNDRDRPRRAVAVEERAQSDPASGIGRLRRLLATSGKVSLCSSTPLHGVERELRIRVCDDSA